MTTVKITCKKDKEYYFDLNMKDIKPLTSDYEYVFKDKENGKYMLDLWAANRLILENAGIKRENICVTDLCTSCESNYFHSHRATGGNRGLIAAVIALKDK